MIDYIDTAGDVIACTISGGFTSAEMSALVTRVEHALEANAKTHMYVEIGGLGDVDFPIVLQQLPRSIAMLRELGRFGRIAVVSDDPWIRLWTRGESALLPNISYELFRARERDRALDWVQGRCERPHTPALKIVPTGDESVIAYEINGSVTAADMDKAVATFGPLLESGTGPVRALARVGELDFPSLSALLKDPYLDLKNDTLRRLERYAVVGGPDWLRKAIKLMAPLLTFDVRWFEPSEEDAAWRWIGASPETSPVTSGAAAEAAIA